MRVKRTDVAKKAGVSTATVSYVLNNSCSISEETRQRVLQAVEELNYKPNMIARSLVTSETKQLSIVIDEITNPFFGEIIIGFEKAAIEKGYFVNICTGYKNLDDYFDNFISRNIDGVFIAAITNKYNIEKIYDLINAGIKVVTGANLLIDIKKVSVVEIDSLDAMDKAVEYLVKLGHRNIAYVSGLSRLHKTDRRMEGYLNAVKKYNLPCKNDLCIEGSAPFATTINEGYNLTKKLIASSKKFSAITCTNDLMAIGAIKALEEKGVSVPGDVSVVGYDGIYLGEVWKPSITTMAFPRTLIGQKAFELLYTNIKNGYTGYYTGQMELIARKSTGLCR